MTSLDPARNRVPDPCRRIHLMGICGTGMAALAGMLREKGFAITGSDENVYPPMSDFLAQAGIPVDKGYRAENLDRGPDLVIVGNVIRATNPEARALAERGLPYLSMPQALAHFFLAGRTPLVVAGTHGKTTTSSLLATTLHRVGRDPGCMIGGIVEAFGANFRLGQGEFFVVEGDEYDTAFFNKVSKFLHYRPRHAILTSIEFDHADIFADFDAVRASFQEFVRLLPADGILMAHGDDPVVMETAVRARCRVITYGQSADCEYRLTDLAADGPLTRFRVLRQGRDLGRFTLNMVGRHNCLNGTAVIGLLERLGMDPAELAPALASFEGVRRRQQIRGEVNGITVIDDFAHHPTAVRETTAALRAAWPGRRLVVVFEPRTNSSRRSVFQEQYAESFTGADLVVVREHLPLDSVPAEHQFSSRRLASDLTARGIAARYCPDTDAILDYLGRELRSGDVVAIYSNGGFDRIHDRLLEKIS